MSDKHTKLYRAEQALHAWFLASGDSEPDQSNLSDLLCDLMALAADCPEDYGSTSAATAFDEALACARINFEAEQNT